jgi:phosphate-selective porin OprO/OprP
MFRAPAIASIAWLSIFTGTLRAQEFVGNQANYQRSAVQEVDLQQRVEQLEVELSKSELRLEALEGAAAPKTQEKEKPKYPTLNLSGVFQTDAVMFHQTDENRLAYGEIQNGADFRRARLGAKGSVSDAMDYFMQMDFGFFGRPTFTDLWVDFKDATPFGTVRVGQWKQPFSLEAVSSFRYTTFMERSSLFQAFVPFRHLGVGIYDHSQDETMTWALSYLRTGQDQFGGSLSTDGGNGLAGRVTQLGWYDCQGTEYLHLGLGYFFNAPPDGRARFRSIPEIYVGDFALPAGEPIGSSGQAIPTVAMGTPFFVDTGVLTDTSLIHTVGPEMLWVHGPLSLQSEFMGTYVDSGPSENGFLYGSYMQVGYFLTGEHRPYDRKAGAIDRVIPFQSVTKKGGIGAWELATRWSYLDLTDRQIRGGELQDFTFGLNWYVNPYCKCVFNYIHSWAEARPTRNGTILNQDSISSQSDAFGLRCQIDF